MCTIGANWLEPTATQVVFVVRFLKKLVEHAIYGGMLAALPDYVATHFTWQRCQPPASCLDRSSRQRPVPNYLYEAPQRQRVATGVDGFLRVVPQGWEAGGILRCGAPFEE